VRAGCRGGRVWLRACCGRPGGRRGFSRPTHDIDECQFSVLPTANTSLATAAAADDGWSVTDARYLSMASSHSSVSHPALARSARRPLFSAHVETIFNDPVSQEGTCNKFGCVRPYVRMFASTWNARLEPPDLSSSKRVINLSRERWTFRG